MHEYYLELKHFVAIYEYLTAYFTWIIILILRIVLYAFLTSTKKCKEGCMYKKRVLIFIVMLIIYSGNQIFNNNSVVINVEGF